MKDFYETLGVSRNADGATLKSAYRKLAKTYHPDRNPGDESAEQKFKEISAAYEVLKDEQKRSAYDRYGHEAFTHGGGGKAQGAAGAGFAGAAFSDLFDEMFGDFMGGQRARRPASQRGGDLRYDVSITLEEAFNGKSQKIRIPTVATCDTCSGAGGKDGSEGITCTTCNGFGKVRGQQGFFAIERTCPACGGAGVILEDPCTDCYGNGRVEKRRELEINIPAGIEDGTRIRLSGEGEAGFRGGAAGDLYVFVTVKSHKFFERSGADLLCRVPIAMTTAVLGGKVNIPGIQGSRIEVNVPEGTQHSKRLRIKDKGMPILRQTTRGDLYVELQVETPVNLTKKQKELLEAFEESCKGRDISPQSNGFLDRVKGLWQELTD